MTGPAPPDPKPAQLGPLPGPAATSIPVHITDRGPVRYPARAAGGGQDRRTHVPQLLIDCPETGRPVYTGLNLDWFAFESTDLAETTLQCPECGGRHVWSKADAYLRADGGEG